MEIIFNGRQTDVPARFREYAIGKLGKLDRLDQNATRVDVEVSVERNPRQASQKERVELTVRSRGPAIRAEAAAEDRMTALDLALAKLDSRLRRAADRRKGRYGSHGPDWTLAEPAGSLRPAEPLQDPDSLAKVQARHGQDDSDDVGGPGESASQARVEGDSVVPISMEGDGPLVVRQKFHRSDPISIDQALLELELIGHDFYLFVDVDNDLPSVVYRRRGYQYGVIRLVEGSAPHDGTPEPGAARRHGDAQGGSAQGGPSPGNPGTGSSGPGVPGRRRPESSGAARSDPASRGDKAAAART